MIYIKVGLRCGKKYCCKCDLMRPEMTTTKIDYRCKVFDTILEFENDKALRCKRCLRNEMP